VAEPEAPPLEHDQRRALAQSLEEWAERHPEPDAPIFGFAGSRMLSPRELAVALADSTEEGEQFFYAVRFVLEIVSFERFISTFEASTEMGAGA
jgi:hypothetical protein